MEDTAIRLDVTGLASELDALADAARLAAGAEGTGAVLAVARSVLERLRAAPGDDAGESAGSSAAAAQPHGWHATRFAGGTGDEDVACWREGPGDEAFYQGLWKAGALDMFSVTVGSRVWGGQATPHGEMEFGPDEGIVEGPALARFHADSDRRMGEQRRALEEALSTLGGWDCPSCAWFNQDGVVACERCGRAAAMPALGAARPAAAKAADGEEEPRDAESLTSRLLGKIRGAVEEARRAATDAKAPGPSGEDRGDETCAKCRAAMLPADQFCPECGAPRAVLCPSCRKECRPGVKFCTHCGASVSDKEEGGAPS